MNILINSLKITFCSRLFHLNWFLLFLGINLTITHPAFALGRLFMTPEMRTQFEQQPGKDLNQQNDQTQDNNLIRLNGFVKPKKGASTIWVNGLNKNKVQHKNAHIQHWVSPKNQISIDLQGSNVQLSPGQVLDIENRTVQESYHMNSNLDTTQNDQNPDKTDALAQPADSIDKSHSAVSDAQKMQQQISAIPVLDMNK